MEYEFEIKLKEIISRCGYDLNPSMINKNSNLVNDFDFTSIDLIELVVEIESEFDVEFEDDDLALDKLAEYDILVNKIRDSIGAERC